MSAAEPLPVEAQRRWSRRKVGTTALRVALPVAVFVIFVSLWQAGVFHRMFDLHEYTVPKPKTIVQTLHDRWSEAWPAQWTTLVEALWGYALGAVAGLGIAVLVAVAGAGRRVVPSIAGAIVAIPIVALAPISVLYFGYGEISKIAVVTLLCAAVTVLNVSKGLEAVGPDPLDLMHSYAAPRWMVITKVRLPNSLPFLFVALKYNVTLALVAAIIAEFFGGYNGVGIEIVQTLADFDMPLTWAAMLLVSVVGIVWFQIVAIIERFATSWHASNRSRALGL
jgi:NitT/TauT family transport system permease protein